MSLSCHLFLSGASRTALILSNSFDRYDQTRSRAASPINQQRMIYGKLGRVGPRQEECATWLASPYTAILLVQEGAQAAVRCNLLSVASLRVFGRV
ncbi:uncharacterized protein LACBIDRAFT_318549 [Laccaria bicolor S238N-H82]|uniref:Predicted protein n=1 Tax=Laccaria bicolor (strain S238N-H82 / ATCC MYA-4686) TaxID=486041 RepID=B0E2M5_LACBS|nr:uncharacterized protein LACBIDRAFT_318549 [Laccaria bicolor S238N-H82]EDQ98895.1 predicted protein [Laccaria bicolor S238N-H82]|eukprot:XP_001890440.1 predicted protein [Laccaria bicolor S238N-H82]